MSPLLAAALALAGCEDERSPTFGTAERPNRDIGTLYVNNGGEPEHLDPGKCGDRMSSTLVMQLFEGLTAIDPRDGHPVQGVATAWDQSDDNRLFRFYLRAGAAWSDGQPVTAHDFAYAWRRVLRPATASRSVSHLYLLKNGARFHQGRLMVLRAASALLDAPQEGARPIARLEAGAVVEIVERRAKQDGKTYALVERYDDLPTFVPRAGDVGARAAPQAPRERGFVDGAALALDERVLGVRAVDDRTLEVELERPAPYFIELTSYPTLFPVRKAIIERFEALGEPDRWVRPENIITNGPYTLESWIFRSQITMKENPHYWNAGQLKTHRIVWLEVEDSHATMHLYKTGEIDYLGDNTSLPAEYLSRLASKKDYITHDMLGVYWYDFNIRKPPLDDARVRHALAMTVDRAEIIARITHGQQKPATHYVPAFIGGGYAPPSSSGHEGDPLANVAAAFDPAHARALLGEAGYEVVADGEGYRARGFPPLEILYNTSEGHRKIAVAIQDMWKRHLGVSVTLRNEEWKVMLQSVREGHFQIVRGGWNADYDHPHTFLEQFTSHTPQNQTGWADPAFEAALSRAAEEPNRDKSMLLYREAEAIAIRAMPRLPIYFYTRSTLVKPWVKGFWPSSRNVHLLQYMWIDPDFGSGVENEPAYPPPELWPPGRYSR